MRLLTVLSPKTVIVETLSTWPSFWSLFDPSLFVWSRRTDISCDATWLVRPDGCHWSASSTQDNALFVSFHLFGFKVSVGQAALVVP